MDKTKLQTYHFHFTDAEKHQIIQEMLSTQATKQAMWKKYTGRDEEHGKIIKWMRQLGYDSGISFRRFNFESNLKSMAQKKPVKIEKESNKDSSEHIELKRRIADLEKQLKEAELKAIAYSTMIDIAEKELKIPIRKKFNTKPLQK